MSRKMFAYRIASNRRGNRLFRIEPYTELHQTLKTWSKCVAVRCKTIFGIQRALHVTFEWHFLNQRRMCSVKWNRRSKEEKKWKFVRSFVFYMKIERWQKKGRLKRWTFQQPIQIEIHSCQLHLYILTICFTLCDASLHRKNVNSQLLLLNHLFKVLIVFGFPPSIQYNGKRIFIVCVLTSLLFVDESSFVFDAIVEKPQMSS